MLELTVKTLDSQNHSFTLPDEATVFNLKESIFEKMEVPVFTQRLIFHGKVLHDQKKLTEYGDVNGKVIHLVQRAPPSSTPSRPSGSSAGRSESGSNGGREGRIPPRPNATYLGSMPFPPDFVDAQGLEVFSTMPNAAMARNRIDCAKRMLGYAKQSIRHTTDPSSGESSSGERRRGPQVSQGTATAPTTSSTEDRGTSTSTAAGSSSTQQRQESINQTTQAATAAAIAAAVQAAQHVGMPSITIVRGSERNDDASISFHDHNADVAVEVEIESSDAEMEGRAESEQNVPENNTGARPPPTRDQGASVDTMVPLLQDLENIHTQLQPLLANCRDLLSTETVYPDETTAPYQQAVRTFNGVSETLHSLAHACHALSDLMVDFYEDPPRSLRCRPVFLQHSTILETGFPLRFNPQDFEAQIDVRRVDLFGNTENTSAATTATSTSTTSTASAANANRTSANTFPSGARNGGVFVAAGISPPMASDSRFPMQSDLEFYMDLNRDGMTLHSLDGTLVSTLRSGENSNATTTTTNSTSSAPNTSTTTSTPAPPPFTSTATSNTNTASGNSSDRHVTFSPVPDIRTYVRLPASRPFSLLHTVQAIAGEIQNQLMNRAAAMQQAGGNGNGNGNGNGSATTTPEQVGASSGSTVSATATSTATATTESAAVTTEPQTLGTEATASSTRPPLSADSANQSNNSEFTPPPPPPPLPPPPRRGISVPVGDMFQTLFHGTFDPTLPCNSHHIRTTRQRASQTPRVRLDEAAARGAIQIFSRRLPTLEVRRRVNIVVPTPNQPAENAPRPDNPDAVTFEEVLPVSPLQEWRKRWLNRLLRASPADGPISLTGTIADFLTRVSDSPLVEGSTIISDLLMTLARNLTWADVVNASVMQGPFLDALFNRLHPVLLEFVTRHLLQGEDVSEDAINRACERLFGEVRPYIDTVMHRARLRESVDLSATINNYNQSQLPAIISVILEPPGRFLGSRLNRLLTNYVRQLMAIIIHCCVDGEDGFDDIVRNCVRLLTRGVPEELQQWSERQSVNNMHYYTEGLNVPLEDIQRYLVYRIPNAPATETASAPQEPMETDPPAGDTTWVTPESIPSPEKVDEPIAEALVAMDTENLPEVVIGSESWHGPLPAEWVPVITRDSQRQRKQTSQKPFSDAYLTGMPPKRRKIIAASKPQGESVAQNISDGLRQAIHSAGVSSPSAERAITDAGRDPVLQQAYKQQEKAVGSEVLRSDPDYKPSRYPNAHKYFDK